MNVPLLDLRPQYDALAADLEEAVLRVLRSTQYILGPDVAELESEAAEYCGAKHAIGLSSGSDALLVALMALDVGPGDTVVTSPYSFFASGGCISRLGARPVYLDVDPQSYNLDPDKLAEFLAGDSPERAALKAIIPVHIFGQCADMDRINALACEHRLPVIEDAAQAIGASYPTASGEVKKAGNMGLCGCFSFFPSKNLGGAGDGGLLTTNDDDFAVRVRSLRVHGAKVGERYYYDAVGGNFRLDSLQAAVLRVKLPHLDAWSEARRRHATYYDANLHADGLVKPATVWGREHHIYNQYVITVADKRDALQAHLKAHGVATAIYYPRPLHLQKCWEDLGYGPGDCPVSEHAAEHTLALPVYPELSEGMLAHVVEKIHAFYA